MSHEDGSRQRRKGPTSPGRNVDNLASVIQRAPPGAQATSSAAPVSAALSLSVPDFNPDTERIVGQRSKKKRTLGGCEIDSQEDPAWIPEEDEDDQAQGPNRTSPSHRPLTRQRLSEPSDTLTTRPLLSSELDRDQFPPSSKAAGQGDVGDHIGPKVREPSRQNRAPDNRRYPGKEAAAATLLSLRMDPDPRPDRSRQPSGAATQANTALRGVLPVSGERLAESSSSPSRRQGAAVTYPLTDSPQKMTPSNVSPLRRQTCDPVSAAAQRTAASQWVANLEEAPRGLHEYRAPQSQTTQSPATDFVTQVESLRRPPQQHGAMDDATTERDGRRDGRPQETGTGLSKLVIRIPREKFRFAEDQRNPPLQDHTSAEQSSMTSQVPQHQNPQAQVYPPVQGSQSIPNIMMPPCPSVQQPTQQARQSIQHPQMQRIAAATHARAIFFQLQRQQAQQQLAHQAPTQLQQLQQTQSQASLLEQQLLQLPQQHSPLMAQQFIMHVQQRLSQSTVPLLVTEQQVYAELLRRALSFQEAQLNQSTDQNTLRRIEIQRIRALANRAQNDLNEIKRTLSRLE